MRSRQSLAALIAVVSITVSGCASENKAPQAAFSATPVIDTPDSASLGPDRQLEGIRQKRLNDSFAPVAAVGPGDLIQVSVPDVDEIKERTERVSLQGNITLPIAGAVHVAGLTDEQVAIAIREKLSKLVKDPEVDVVVLQYIGRQVAVVGMVNKPGLYTMNGRNDTILDMIGRAGGMNEGAGSSVLFIPASRMRLQVELNEIAAAQERIRTHPEADEHPYQVASTAEQPEHAQTEHTDGAARATLSAPPILPAGLTDSPPISINLSNGMGSNLDVPMRPGDMLIVPSRGEVLVQGWVPNPGAYQITPGMTALGAITAAGGQLFSSSAKVLRDGAHGDKIEIPIDLSKVEHGEQPDVAVQSGDVVIVARSATGAIPYAVYGLFNRFGTGVAFPIPY
jgi:protein involved in polysaccharide export with SLBB domain